MGFYKNKAKQNTSIYNEKSDLSMKYNERDKIVLKLEDNRNKMNKYPQSLKRP